MYKVLICDFDGTLAHTLEDVVLCMRETFAAFGQQGPATDAVQRTMGLPLEVALAALRRRDADCDDMALWVNHYRARYAHHGGARTRLYPGVSDVLHRAAAAGIRSILVSNKGRNAIEMAVDRLGLASAVSRVFAADVVRFKKPDARLYALEIKPQLPGIADADVLVVGDSESDLQFARNAGLRSCWAAYGYGERNACLGLTPAIVIQSFAELADTIFEP